MANNFPTLPPQFYNQSGFTNLSWGSPSNFSYSGSVVNAYSSEGFTFEVEAKNHKTGLDCSGSCLFERYDDITIKGTAKGYVNVPINTGSGLYTNQLMPGQTFTVSGSAYVGKMICDTISYDQSNTDCTKFSLSAHVTQYVPLI